MGLRERGERGAVSRGLLLGLAGGKNGGLRMSPAGNARATRRRAPRGTAAANGSIDNTHLEVSLSRRLELVRERPRAERGDVGDDAA